MRGAGLAIWLGVACLARMAAAEAWEVERSEHFLVHHRGQRALAARVATSAERHYDRIVAYLGRHNHGDFWTWDDRVRIRIYPSRQAFAVAQQAPGWAGGSANYAAREIATHVGSDAFLDRVLPHELAHLVFREFLGGVATPLWLDEGVAQYAEAGSRALTRQRLAALGGTGNLLSLETMTRLEVRDLQDARLAALYYAQAADLVGFMIESLGRRRFGAFCRALRDGKALEDAVRFTYTPAIRSMESLEERWHAHMRDDDRE